MANEILELLVKLGVVGKDDVKAANDLLAETKSTTDKAAEATGDLGKAVAEGSEKWGASRREIREAASELGRITGISRLGALALGGIGAAAFAAAKAVEFLKDTWDTITETIQGPIEIGLPENAASHISAAAEAWNDYAAARAKVIENSKSPESAAGREEKRLNTELELIKKVLAAEKEKALAELELRKDSMTPEAYKAAQANIGEIFGEAGTKAEEKNRRALIANKDAEAYDLEISARQKTQQALAIKSAPKEVADANQAALDDNATAAIAAKKEIKERLALIDRVFKALAGESVPEYEGLSGKLTKWKEEMVSWQRYGPVTFDEARGIETTRLTQAQAAIDSADTYRRRQEAARTKKSQLMDEAGTEAGKAVVLRGEIETDKKAESAQNSADNYIASLHQASTAKITGASSQTAAAVQMFTAATVAGFSDVHGIFIAHQKQINEVRSRLADLESRNHTGP